MAVMTLRNAGLIVADALRSLTGPKVFDLRPTNVAVVQRTWSGGRRGNGIPTDQVVLAIPNYTRVRAVTEREVAASGGHYEQGDVLIGPMTPQYTGVDGKLHGLTQAALVPSGAQGVEIIYRLAQQAGATGLVGEYYFLDFRRDRNLRFELVVGRLRTTPGP